jgi:three-Cys-motif partner protein
MDALEGLPARNVDEWEARKAYHVDRYVSMFARLTKFPRRAYVELFSGPGISFRTDLREFRDGSPLRSLAFGFTDYFFVDIDSAARSALESRVTGRGISGRRIHYFTGDCNDSIDAIRAVIPASALTLVFVDPTNWQIRLDSIRRLVEGRRCDLLVTFHTGAMYRVKGLPVPALTAFFGTDRWKAALTLPKGHKGEALRKLYNEQLVPAGYAPDGYLDPVLVKNSKNSEIYDLVLFSKNDLGRKFWREAKKYDQLGQKELGL